MKNGFLKTIVCLTIILVAATSCSKNYLDVTPSNAITLDSVYGSISAVNSAQTSSYLSLFAFAGGNGSTNHDNFGQKAIDLANDLMGNDMIVHSAGYGWFNADYQYTEWQNATSARRSDKTWSFYYDIIKQCNLILDNASDPVKVAGSTTADIERVKGECLGVRAWCYFNLINNFQQTYKGNESKPGVPVVTTFSIAAKGRGKVSDVYDQIKADLTTAETLLNGKARPAKTNVDVSVVRGFRARVALAMEDWATAATYANKARQGYTLISASAYANRATFSTIGTNENMWGSLIPASQATIYASFYSHIDASQLGYAGLGGQKKIPKALYDQIPATDARKSVFALPTSTSTQVPPYCQIKLEVPVSGSWAGDYIYMRAAEMYLIEAEALARQGGQDAAARTVLESLITTRNPSYSAAAFSGTDLVNEILLQRRIELWGEGFSLFDIKRTKTGLNRLSGTGNHGTPSLNPVVYQIPDGSPLFLMRIPQRELDNNTAMTPADQNP